MASRRVCQALLGALLGSGCTAPPPELRNLLVELGDYDAVSGRAGDFVFLEGVDVVFLEFDAEVEGPDGPKRLPTFEYRLDPSAEVRAPVAGRIERLVYQADDDDYELTIGGFGRFAVNVDHVKDPTVAEGDEVLAGDVLGRPGSWSDTLGRTELMVTEGDLAHCPFSFVAPDRADALEAQVSALMADWEAFVGDPGIYDEAAMVRPGCNSLVWSE